MSLVPPYFLLGAGGAGYRGQSRSRAQRGFRDTSGQVPHPSFSQDWLALSHSAAIHVLQNTPAVKGSEFLR